MNMAAMGRVLVKVAFGGGLVFPRETRCYRSLRMLTAHVCIVLVLRRVYVRYYYEEAVSIVFALAVEIGVGT